MNSKTKVGLFSLLFLVCVTVFSLISLSGTPASANSAMRYFEGVDSSGVLLTTENCPVIVESEELTFDINTSDYVTSSDIGGTVTAKYTFKNPADYSAEVDLLFPIGFLNSYYSNTESSVLQYSKVTAGGKDVPKTLRYSYKSYWSDEFDYQKDASLLSDTYIEKEDWKTDLTVYKYVYDVHATGRAVRFSVTGYDGIVVSDASGYENDDKEIHIAFWLTAETQDETSFQEKYTVYFIGKDNPSFANTAEYYKTMTYEESATGTIEVVSKEAMTFLDMVKEFKPEDSDVSDVDWYNATVTELDNAHYFGDEGGKLASIYDFDVSSALMCWYEYKLAFEPGETIVNEVTAPLYPDADYGYDPAIFTFNYYLSPAKTWASFGSLTIRINTSHYMSEPSIEGFEKFDGYYQYTGNGLPNGELKFSICESESPEEVYDGFYTFIIVALIIGFVVIVVIPITIIVVIIVKVKKRKKRKAKELEGKDRLSAERVDPRDVFGKNGKN